MQPLPLLDDRYTLLGRLGTCRSCTAYLARDDRLQREVTVTVLEDGDPARRQTFIEASRRLVRTGAVEVYDASSHYLVTGVLAAPAALAVAERLAPPSTDAEGGRRARGPSRLGAHALERTRPAVGLAATSTLLLLLSSFVAPPLLDDGGADEPMPAVMGVFLPQPDLRLLAETAPKQLRATPAERRASSRPSVQPAPPPPAEPDPAAPAPETDPDPEPEPTTETGGVEAPAPEPPPRDPAPVDAASEELPPPAAAPASPPRVDAPPPRPMVVPPAPPVVEVVPPEAPGPGQDDKDDAGSDRVGEHVKDPGRATGGASETAPGEGARTVDKGRAEGKGAGKGSGQGTGKGLGQSGGAGKSAGAANRGARA